MKKSKPNLPAATLTRYAIVEDNEQGPFEPVGWEYACKKDAVKSLRETQRRYPHAYLAEVTYSRC